MKVGIIGVLVATDTQYFSTTGVSVRSSCPRRTVGTTTLAEYLEYASCASPYAEYGGMGHLMVQVWALTHIGRVAAVMRGWSWLPS